MNYLVIGCGSIGKRHIRNLKTLGIDTRYITAIETRKDRQEEIKNLGISKIYEDIDLALKENKFNAAIICSPTNLHTEQAIKLAKNKINFIIEKPLCNNLNDVDKLVNLVNENKLIVLVAYIFRFAPITQKVKEILNKKLIGKVLYARGEFSEYLPDWHPYEDYRTFYMAEKKQGGGSILDQSHIFDLVHYLLGNFKSVIGIVHKQSSLEVNADDISELIVRLENNILVSLHTDIFGRGHKKYLEIKGEKGNITWDFYENSVKVYNSESNSESIFKKFDKDFNNSYIEELKHFNDCVKNNKQTIANLDVGIDTMKLIEAAEKSSLEKKEKLI